MNEAKAHELLRELVKHGIRLVAAESCTAGLVASGIAQYSGASEALWGSYICYSEDAKCRMLNISQSFIKTYGAVSEECAIALAENARSLSGSDVAVSVTGWAGPSGGDSRNPVGTVWIGTATAASDSEARRYSFTGDRDYVRLNAAAAAWDYVLERIQHIYNTL